MDEAKALNLSKLSKEQLAIIKDGGTEKPFSGKLLDNHSNGNYNCAACGAKLFGSDAKFDSNSGWPSFDQAIPGSVMQLTDSRFGMERIEVVCANCKAHLGHLFDDGPQATTGQRFCINSACLDFKPKQK